MPLLHYSPRFADRAQACCLQGACGACPSSSAAFQFCHIPVFLQISLLLPISHKSCFLQGACGTCPSSSATMKMGIERALKAAFGDALKDVMQASWRVSHCTSHGLSQWSHDGGCVCAAWRLLLCLGRCRVGGPGRAAACARSSRHMSKSFSGRGLCADGSKITNVR